MTLTELFTNIANAIRAKTGSTEPIIAEDFPSAIEAIEVGSTIDLDAEVTEQETIAASQDALVGDIMAALEGKAIGGKTTKTINIDWSYDPLGSGLISYFSNNEVHEVSFNDNITSIEAEGGVIIMSCEDFYASSVGSCSSGFSVLLEGWEYGIMVAFATQDGEILYPSSLSNEEEM